MWLLATVPKNTAIAPTGTSATSNASCDESAAATTRLHPSAAAAPVTMRADARAHIAAASPPITVPTPRIAMSRPARPTPPPNPSLAISVRNVGKL